MNLNSIKGLGPKKIQSLNDKGINSINELILFYPITYDIFTPDINNDFFVIEVEINTSLYNVRLNNATVMTTFSVIYENQKYKCSSFKLRYAYKNFKKGMKVFLYGAKTNDTINVFMLSYEFQTIFPVYSSIKGMSNKTINNFINTAIMNSDIKNLKDIYVMHNPKNIDELSNSMFRLKCSEFSEYIDKVENQKLKFRLIINNFKYIDNGLVLKKMTPISFYEYQKEPLNNLLNSLEQSTPQKILLQGDVGCGKTLFIIASILKLMVNEQKIVVVAPTRLLVNQLYEEIINYIDKSKCVAVSGNVTKTIVNKVNSNKSQVIITTSSIANASIELSNVACFIFDEQQKFGVDTKTKIISRYPSAHTIEVSATPIPRSMTESKLGISKLIKIMSNKSNVESNVITHDYMDLVKSIVNLNDNLVVVCPTIESEYFDTSTIDNVSKEFRGNNIDYSIINSKTSFNSQLEIINKFKNRDINVLLVTSIFEVGIDIANVSNMIVLSADRFGMSQLHQFRGRVARGITSGNCYFYTNTKNQSTLDRLNYLVNNNDGSSIAEFDLYNRGSGNVLNSQQTGDIKFRLFNPDYDYDIIEYVFKHIK